MNVLDADFTLYEIELTLERRLRAEEKGIRTIGDLNLSYEDYKYLVLKVKGLTKYITRIEVFEQYKLSIVTALVYTMRYEEEITETYSEVRKIVDQLQQHHVRYCIRLCANTFYELGLSTYGVQMNTLDDLIEVVMIHAGLSNDTLQTCLQLLDEYYSTDALFLYEDELYTKMEQEILKSCPIVHKGSNYHKMVYIIQNIYEGCYVRHLSMRQLVEEYRSVSKSLIENCYMWYVKYGSNSNRLVKIR